MGSPSLGTGLPRLSPAMWYPDSADCVLTWETGLVGPRFPQLPPLITALLSFCIVFTAVRLLLLSQGTDRLTPNHRAENNTRAKETVHKTWFLLVGLGWGGSREMEKMQTLNPFNDRSNKNFYSERDKIVLRIKIIWQFQNVWRIGFFNLRSYLPVKITLEISKFCLGQITKSHLILNIFSYTHQLD